MNRDQWRIHQLARPAIDRILDFMPIQIFHLWIEGKRVGMKHLPPGAYSFRVKECRELNSRNNVPVLLLDLELADTYELRDVEVTEISAVDYPATLR